VPQVGATHSRAGTQRPDSVDVPVPGQKWKHPAWRCRTLEWWRQSLGDRWMWSNGGMMSSGETDGSHS